MSTKRKPVQNRAPAPPQNRAPAPGGMPANPNADPMQAIEDGFAAMNQRIDSLVAPAAGSPGTPVAPPVTPPAADTRAAGDAPTTPPVVPPVTPTAPAPVTPTAVPPVTPAAPTPPPADTRAPVTPPVTPTAAPLAPAPAMADFQQRFDTGMAGVNERLIGMEQRLIQSRAPAAIIRPGGCACHETLIASDQYRQDWTRGVGSRVDHLPSILIEELMGPGGQQQRASAAEILGSAELAGMSNSYYRPSIVQWATQRYGLWEFLNKKTTDRERIEIIKETETSGRAAVYTEVKTAIDGDPTAKTTCEVDNAEGFEGGMMVSFPTVAGGNVSLRLVSVNKSTAVLTFATDAITFDLAVDEPVVCESIGVTEEEALKPYSYMAVEVQEETLRMIAVMLAITVQRMKLAPELLTWMQTHLRGRVKKSYSYHCLYGTDTNAGQLAGFFSETGAKTLIWSSGTPVGTNMIDAIYMAADLILTGGQIGVGMHPKQWTQIVLLKDNNGQYLSPTYGPVKIVDMGPGARWIGQFPVEVDPHFHYTAGTESDVLVADFMNAHELYINPNLSAFEIGLINDDFELNIRRPRYEEAAVNAIINLNAYVWLDLDAAPA